MKNTLAPYINPEVQPSITKPTIGHIVNLALQLSETERITLVRLLRQLESSSDDKHWENYL
jgi:hypothetical protein